MAAELSDEQVACLLRVLAERTRATNRTLDAFVPPQVGILDEVKASQHQLIVGRRGVGKSMLLLNVADKARADGDLVVYLDLESFRGIPYPDVLVRLLIQLAETLGRQLSSELGFWRSLGIRRRLGRLRRELQRLLPLPQEELTSVTTEDERGRHTNADVDAGLGAAVDEVSVSTKFGFGRTARSATTRSGRSEFVTTKMEGLLKAVPEYRAVLSSAVGALARHRTLILLDDFYFIPKSYQPDVLGYLHQLVKGVEIWMKVGGVEYRLNSFREGDPPQGLQPFHDAGRIRLDATLRDFAHTKSFLEGVLARITEEAEVELDDVITATGKERLVLASGGVPRDYLNLTAAALRQASKRGNAENRPRNRVNAEDVSEVAPEFLDQKEEELRLDASESDVERLRQRFNDIVRFCVHEQGRNVFLVEATKLREEEWGQDLAALSELRFIHRVKNLTIKSSNERYTGRRYEAFVLDLSAYAGTRVRNIEMIPFWTTEGAQKIRGATFVYRPSQDGGDRPADDLASAERAGEQLEFEITD